VIVPLRIGGGTRLKILEAMAMGKAIVSTNLGAEGIDVEHDRDTLLADTPEEFAQQVQRALDDPALRARLGAAARRTAVDHYGWRAAAAKMNALLEEVVKPAESAARASNAAPTPPGPSEPASAAPGHAASAAQVSVTALVCTRNRPEQNGNAVRSLLDSDESVELIVVDQSPGDATERRLAVARPPALRLSPTRASAKAPA
jgi:hypothetical protein